MENQTDSTGQTQTDTTLKAQASTTSHAKKKCVFNMNKRATLFMAVVLIIVGALFYFKGLFIAAIVNGKPISRLEVIRELENTSGRQALDALIVKRLIETEASKAGITVSQADIDAEIQILENKISKQGGTLDLILAQQGITPDQFREQILLRKKLEKILENNIQVSDDEVNQYFEKNKITPPTGTAENEVKNQIREQLKNQKLSAAADKFITDLKSKAAIQYYVNYGEPAPAPEPPAQAPTPAPANPPASMQKQ